MSSFKLRNDVKPLSQDNLSKSGNACVVHDSNESSFLTPVTPGSFMGPQTPSILDVHLSATVINSLKEAGGYEPNIP